MGDGDILKDLRDQVLDDDQPIAGLLRKCLALGALTDSDELRTWANNELKGYPDDAPLPPYRSITAPLYIDTISGNFVSKGQQINHLQIPKDLRGGVPEALAFRQPIQEVAQMATSAKQYQRMGYGSFSLVAAEWTKKLGMFQSVNAIYFSVATTAIGGIVDTVRTALLEIVIDLTKDVPLDKLPNKAQVDSAVQVHVGSNDKYEVNVSGSNSGIIGQGAGSTQIQNQSVPKELVDLIGTLRATLPKITDDEKRADAEQAIADFEESVSEDDPKPDKIKRRWGLLERVGTALGSAVLTQAVKEGAPVVMDHLQLLT
ncbi:AbiTii domain-containing protein [Mycobacterium sp. NPDC004974]